MQNTTEFAPNPIQQNLQEEKKQTGSFSLVYILLFLLVIFSGFLGFQLWRLNQQVLLTKSVSNTQPQQSAELEQTPLPKTAESEIVPVKEESVSKTEVIDKEWKKYSNSQLGFSINFPIKSSHYGGACSYSTENGDHSYRLSSAEVENVVIEDKDSIYLAAKTLFQLEGETKEDFRSFFASCEQKETTLAQLQKERRTWNILVKTVNDEEGVESFIKARFGDGCQLGEKTETTQPGVFDVKVKGDGKDISETACPINYMFVIRYAPQKQKIFSWDLGQSINFSSQDGKSSYDQDIVKSFQVL